jgi:hypothetical protein
MKVSNMTSNSSGKEVANQFIIRDDNGNEFFQSYDSIIVKIDKCGQIYLDETYWDYSKTTGKYRNKYLGETKAETQKKIDNGTYELTNLNK